MLVTHFSSYSSSGSCWTLYFRCLIFEENSKFNRFSIYNRIIYITLTNKSLNSYFINKTFDLPNTTNLRQIIIVESDVEVKEGLGARLWDRRLWIPFFSNLVRISSILFSCEGTLPNLWFIKIFTINTSYTCTVIAVIFYYLIFLSCAIHFSNTYL